jgi:hypothetical protein
MNKYIYDFNTAYDIALPFVNNAIDIAQWNSDKWFMTPSALNNTLNYIFNVINHHCYMLCVNNTTHFIDFYKLRPKDISDSARSAVNRKLLKMDNNPFMTNKQKDFIRDFVDQPLRIMQCVIKHVQYNNNNDLNNRNEYLDIFSKITIPDGVYIFSLTDAVILRDDLCYPFPMVFGKRLKIPNLVDQFIPIISLSGMHGYRDVSIPNYDDINFILGGDLLPNFNDWSFSWDEKTISRAVFRGGATGCGLTSHSNQRIHLAEMGSKKKYDSFLDAGIVSSGVSIDTRSVKFDPLYGIGVMNTHIKPVSFMSMAQQSKHKYIIHLDGNVNAYRFLTSLLTGSLIIRVKSKYTAWFESFVKPGVHFIEVSSDLSDLISAIKWCQSHDPECRKIAEAGRAFALSMIDNQGHSMLQHIQSTFLNISGYNSYSDLIEFPVGKTRCPNGYTVKVIDGKKFCKKTLKKFGGYNRKFKWT